MDGSQEHTAGRFRPPPGELIPDVGPPQQRALLQLFGTQRSLEEALQHRPA